MRRDIIVLTLMLFIVISVAGERSLLVDGAFGQVSKENDAASRSSLEKLGKDVFFDKNLSNPPGTSCASCHNPEAGFAGAIDSKINQQYGVSIGSLPSRCVNRNPSTLGYVKFCPTGPPVFDKNLQSYVGGFSRDGRIPDLKSQVRTPLMHANQMNNNNDNAPAPHMVVEKIQAAQYAPRFRQMFGPDIFDQSDDKVLNCLAEALAAFESSKEVSPFSSKYDAFLAGKAQLTQSEKNGFELVTGLEVGRHGKSSHKSAQCVACHAIQLEQDNSPDLFTQYGFANIGVPRNLSNPYYYETNKQKNPLGYNPSGWNYVDFGLGDFLYPQRGLPPGNLGIGSDGKGDFLSVNGAFKVPTLRNVDKRPDAGFVKAYTHNGYFKNLKDIVHFYNTRNLTSVPGETIDFTKEDPYQSLKGKPMWSAPEYSTGATLVNPTGKPGQIGNLGLTENEEADIVAFLKTLSDGYQAP